MGDRTVGEVAKATGLTVRTLHHYDAIGLVVPSGRSASGYRLYADEDVERLHAVCTYRALGLSLESIAEILAEGDTDLHLRRQHALVSERIARLRDVQLTLETMIEARSINVNLTPEETFELFGEHDPGAYQDEVEERWGQTDAYRESTRRVRRYGPAEWREIKTEGEAIEQRFAELLRQGCRPDAPEARAAAERHRAHIERWFYSCPLALHRGLAELYVTDRRFAAHYDGREPGLAEFVSTAIAANAAAAQGDPA
jgi:DNA-binding transcriptional MerR regulator